ncbi:MAG: MoaD/ThiS family protein [Bacteroidetes bacterium]|nr:MoaD/ThiS family protein [Bacteroidota bacterium]MCL5024907.1 MoaD/ThiS family protein [Chloroflexota bacterium]
MSEVTVEFIPWLSQQLEPGRSGRLVVRESVQDNETVRDLLERMARNDPKLAANVFDLKTRNLHEHVAAVLNDRMIELLKGLDEPLKPGDTLTLLPTFQGG